VRNEFLSNVRKKSGKEFPMRKKRKVENFVLAKKKKGSESLLHYSDGGPWCAAWPTLTELFSRQVC
jgi:hypothetical protein